MKEEQETPRTDALVAKWPDPSLGNDELYRQILNFFENLVSLSRQLERELMASMGTRARDKVTLELDLLGKVIEAAKVRLQEAEAKNAELELALQEARRASPSAGQWIAVTERLPEEGVPVLCTPGWVDRIYIDEYVCSQKRFLMEIEEPPFVTHWMPLPAPPLSDIKGERD